ncbi:MAG: OmpH family outer membrane protein [Alphaproteobacteria bacterium]|nr:MAG: OmpH family outer membrane protein [Alphaproteobacteria bacterium]
MRAAMLALAAALVSLAMPLSTAAQQLEMPISPILVIDQERLLSETRLGAEIARRLESRAEALAAENRRIESELIAEEQALTETRKTMSAAEFRPLAEAFDQKVQRIRAEQDAKERALAKAREEERARFLGRIVPILGQLARERGAVAILDRRVVFLAADSIDVTEDAIGRINALLSADHDASPTAPGGGDAATGDDATAPAPGEPAAKGR